MTAERAIAIVGLAGRFPSAPSVDALWELIVSGRSASREVPADRWPAPAAQMVDATGSIDHARGGRACLLDPFEFSPGDLDLDQGLIPRLSPLAKLTLQVAVDTFRSAGSARINREKTAAIIANIALPTDGASKLSEQVFLGSVEAQLFGASLTGAAEPLDAFPSAWPVGLMARALSLGRGSYTLDAACASSLYALYLGCLELEAGRLDAVLAGGVSLPQALYTQVGFSQLHALSPSGVCAPFTTAADGLVVGEGAGMVLLKRLEDAQRDGDHVHAVIRGLGVSNDVGGSLLSPDSEGQQRAMRSAYAQAGWQPSQVELVECHGTGTPRGDSVELASLKAVFGDTRVAIGSVKSTVGHLLTAAGMAGLSKVLGAFSHQTLPPSANVAGQVVAELAQGFEVISAARAWPRPAGHPRRAAISGFGFGGINAHLLLEEYVGQRSPVSVEVKDAEPVAIVGLGVHVGVLDSLDAFRRGAFESTPSLTLRPPTRWKTNDARVLGSLSASQQGGWIEALEIPLGRFKVPPLELQSVLPQQLLMLEVAANAIDDAGGFGKGPHVRTGAVVGLGLDLEATSFQLRWVLEQRARRYLAQAGLDVTEAELAQWVSAVANVLSPPLDAQRTLGALGGIVTSRLARELSLGGPCFAVQADEGGGLRALEVATRLLQQGDVDRMIVGAVELAGDVRRVFAAQALSLPSGRVPGDGAAAVVLKRLRDARAAGDRIYAVVRGFGAARDVDTATARAWSEVQAPRAWVGVARDADTATSRASSEVQAPQSFVAGAGDVDTAAAPPSSEARTQRSSLAATSEAGGSRPRGTAQEGGVPTDEGLSALIGETGSASGLLSLVRGSLSLHHRVLPPSGSVPARVFAPGSAPRRLGVSTSAMDGSHLHVVLEEPSAESSSSLLEGRRGAGLFLVEASRIADLKTFAQANPSAPIDGLAAQWFHHHRADSAVAAFVATSVDDLLRQLEDSRPPVAKVDGELAFIFPGSGSHFDGMGESLMVAFPQVLDRLGREVHDLSSLLSAPIAAGPAGLADVIIRQVVHGVVLHDALTLLGVKAQAYLGYSLGESTALFASRTWRDHDAMLHRTSTGPLFRSQLTSDGSVMRAAFGQDARWSVALVRRSRARLESALTGTARVLLVNTPGEWVIGGLEDDVRAVIAKLGGAGLMLEGVPFVHLPELGAVKDDYRAHHLLPTTPPEGVRFYSAAWARAYQPTPEACADSLVANAMHGFDFTKVIEQAWADGVRIFVEPGPQSSCTRMIRRILGDRPHVAVSACQGEKDGYLALLQAIAKLAEAGVPVNLAPLYPRATPVKIDQRRTVRIPVGGAPLEVPPLPGSKVQAPKANAPAPRRPSVQKQQVQRSEVAMAHDVLMTPSTPVEPQVDLLLRSAQATAAAHEAFLRLSHHSVTLQTQLLQQQRAWLDGAVPVIEAPTPVAPPPRFDRVLCLEFAVGKLSRVLGPAFAAVDAYPTRVRLPAEPLMLVDRITEVEGEPGSLGPGRVVTEHDVLPGAWYLDGGRMPVCVSVEAGQADLFLSAYLGIDLQTKGERVYRLLDAKVEFHRDLPVPGETIRYDIRIDRFIKQGDTWLFFFRFDGTIDGAPFITMFDGCAGFFSSEQLEQGKGIVSEAKKPRRPRANATPFRRLTTEGRATLNDAQVDALRSGNVDAAFGTPFPITSLAPSLRLPDGRMRLVDRILELDTTGGDAKLGLVIGEHDVSPDAWYLTCHFTDDPVMPGTLMYECCLHTLRVLLLRLGWVDDAADVELSYAPIEGQASQLKCRGQVLPTTKKVQYRVEIDELGYGPEPFVIATASMFADGKHVVQMDGMSVRLRGMSRERLEALWSAPRAEVFSRAQILEYCEGAPSRCFGPQYQVFDEKRRLARLPRPPYLFMDRVVACEPKPFVLEPGGWITCEYDVPKDAWYFAANRQRAMPFAVLLEAALQPCGFLAAYVGSALHSADDLSFRNLDGAATALREVTADVGTLTMRARLTKVSKAGGMLLEEFDLEVLAHGEQVFVGRTGFGFFPAASLAQQVGVRGATAFPIPDGARAFRLEKGAPLTPDEVVPFSGTGLSLPAGAFSMIDAVDSLSLDGSPRGFGAVSGHKRVDPAEWFFRAHFFQDPVMPGSLGLEAFQQLLAVYARERFPQMVTSHRLQSMALGQPHVWQYRGQVIPTNSVTQVQVQISKVLEGDEPLIVADGQLLCDGKVIYAMKDFALRLVKEHP